MQENENRFQPLNVCRRLFNFFAKSLIGRGLKHAAQAATQAPADEDGSLKKGLVEKREVEERDSCQARGESRDDSGSEIEIHFKQTEEEEELEYRTPTCEKAEDQKRSIVTDHPRRGGLVQVNGVANGTSPSQLNAPQETGTNLTTVMAAAGGRDRTQPTEENKAAKKNGKTMPTEKLTPSQEPEAKGSKLKPPRRLFDSVSNIDVLSDEFIRTRKEAMQKAQDSEDLKNGPSSPLQSDS